MSGIDRAFGNKAVDVLAGDRNFYARFPVWPNHRLQIRGFHRLLPWLAA